MRPIATWCLGAAATVLCDLAVAERLQDSALPDAPAVDPGNSLRLAGGRQGEAAEAPLEVENTRQGEPLNGAEISERLGMDQSVLVSTWDAGFPRTLTWDPENVVDDGAGGVALRLTMPRDSTARPYRGGEFQTPAYSTVWGRVEWQARLPLGISGSVVGMFLYKDPYTAKTDREFDLEYVPGDPKVAHAYGTMQMTLQMKRHDGSGRREKPSYRIKVPADCIEAVCGWAIEFQPGTVVFQISLNQGGGWETIGRFAHSTGWDLAAGTKYDGAVNGKTLNFSSTEVWSEQAVTAFASYWVTDDQIGWLGALDENDLAGDVPRFEIRSMTPLSYDMLSRFRPDDWAVAATGELIIAGIPSDQLRLTGIQYRLDRGDWNGLDASMAGTFALEPRPAPGQSIEIRSVARGPAFDESGYEIASDPSDIKMFPKP